jgi:hypothetical protein
MFPAGLKQWTCGFKLSKLRLNMSHRTDWEATSALSDKELQTLLRQSFTYLARGAQAYVFESQDHSYVIKFLRFDQPQICRTKKTVTPFHEKMEKMFRAFILAYTRFPEETGLIYLHLNVTEGKLPTLQAKGPLGQSLRLPLDQYRFVIQRKAIPFHQGLLEARGDVAEFHRRIDSFLSLIASRLSQGVSNTDGNLVRNFGYLRGKALEIDCGNYQEGASPDERSHFTQRLRDWVEAYAPEYVPYLDEKAAL